MRPLFLLKKIREVPLNSYLDSIHDPLTLRAKQFHMRQEAKRYIKMVREQKKRTVVDAKLLKKIKAYAHEYFGSKDYWPWLVLYSEIRGEFMEGWVPSDYYRLRLLKKLNPVHSSFLCFKKTFDHRLFGDIASTWIVSKINNTLFDMDMNVLNETSALEKIRAVNGEVVIKKESGRGGKDIDFMDSSQISHEMLSRNFDFLVQEVVKQHQDIAAVYPDSVNTLRITTYMEFSSNVRVLYACMRIGSDGRRVDNHSAGGRVIFFDDSGTCVTDAYHGKTMEVETHHPQTGYQYRNLQISSLERAKEICIRNHYKYPYLRLIGWDVFIDRENNPRLIEWNGKYPGFWPFEAIIGPLWSLEEIQKFRDMGI